MVRPEDASYAEIWINALLKFIKPIDDCIPNFIDLIALPWNWQQYLSSFASGRTCSDVHRVPPMIQNGPTSSAAPLRPGVRHHGSDRPLPVTGRRHVRRLVRCLVRCLVLLPGTACQPRSAAEIPEASAWLGSWGIFKAWIESG